MSSVLTSFVDSYPGATHHGRPMQVIPLGKTDLPMEIILEYLDSLRQIYTVEVRQGKRNASESTQGDTLASNIAPEHAVPGLSVF